MKKIVYGALALVPALGFAQTQESLGSLTGIVQFISKTVSALIPIFFGLAIVYFFWGLVKYIRSAGDPKAAADGKSIMIWGVIAIAVMASIWGLVGWLGGLFGIDSSTGPVNVGNWATDIGLDPQ
jgi:hypothetical protein